VSRPPQVHLQTALRNLRATLESDERIVSIPFKAAVDVDDYLKDAEIQAERLAQFVELSVKAFEALEGLLANWPTTEAAILYEPHENRPTLMKEAALKQAVEALKKYGERDVDFTW
jgi:hypothetical protein